MGNRHVSVMIAGMHYRVAGGPIGGLFGSRVGDEDEMVTTVRGDLARLTALAEGQAGIR